MKYSTLFSLLISIAASLTGHLPVAQAQPAWRTFGRLAEGRHYFRALHIGDQRVLVIGGWTRSFGMLRGDPTTRCEIIDVAQRTISPTGSMATPRTEFAALLTPDSNVIVLSGLADGELTRSCELYDRASGRWRKVGDLIVPRRQLTATFVSDSEVVVVGGRDSALFGLRDVELFNIRTGISRRARNYPWEKITNHVAGVSSLGNALVAGGRHDGTGSPRFTAVNRYDRLTDAWVKSSDLPSVVQAPRMIKLWDGRLAMSGGAIGDLPLMLTKGVWVEENEQFRTLAEMQVGRHWNDMAQWRTDSIMTISGLDESDRPVATTDWIDLPTGRSSPGPLLNIPRSFFEAVAVPYRFDASGKPTHARILAISGIGPDNSNTPTVEILEVCSPIAVPITPTGSPLLCPGDSVTLSAPAGFASYAWSTGAATQSITVTAAGTYTVNVADAQGCSGSGSSDVRGGTCGPYDYTYYLEEKCPGHTGRVSIPFRNPFTTNSAIEISFEDASAGNAMLDTTLPIALTPGEVIHIPIRYTWTTPGLQSTYMRIRTSAGNEFVVRLIATVQGMVLPVLGATDLQFRARPSGFDTCITVSNTFYTRIIFTDTAWSHSETGLTLLSPRLPFILPRGESIDLCFNLAGDADLRDTLFIAGEGLDSCRIPFCIAHRFIIEAGPRAGGILSADRPTAGDPHAVGLRCYPNPLSSSGTIDFLVPRRAYTRLRLFDASGREVALLLAETMEPGIHRVDLDASGLPAGSYTIYLESEESAEARRMMIVR